METLSVLTYQASLNVEIIKLKTTKCVNQKEDWQSDLYTCDHQCKDIDVVKNWHFFGKVRINPLQILNADSLLVGWNMHHS